MPVILRERHAASRSLKQQYLAKCSRIPQATEESPVSNRHQSSGLIWKAVNGNIVATETKDSSSVGVFAVTGRKERFFVGRKFSAD
jgi:hypothetical protein